MSPSSTALPYPHSFPTRRSSDLVLANGAPWQQAELLKDHRNAAAPQPAQRRRVALRDVDRPLALGQDRKSTRLNSSHLVISYAVFCLKKKNIYKTDA